MVRVGGERVVANHDGESDCAEGVDAVAADRDVLERGGADAVCCRRMKSEGQRELREGCRAI